MDNAGDPLRGQARRRVGEGKAPGNDPQAMSLEDAGQHGPVNGIALQEPDAPPAGPSSPIQCDGRARPYFSYMGYERPLLK